MVMARKQVIESRMQELERELAELNAWGEDTYAEGTVIRWKHQFNGCGIRYRFVAVKAQGFWWLTNRNGSKLTWEQLLGWLRQEGSTKIQMSARWKAFGPTDD